MQAVLLVAGSVGFSDMRGNMRVVLVLLMSLGLAGCRINDHTRHRAIDLEFNGGPVNTANYFAALHMCNIVNRYSDGKYNCIARPSPGPVANIDAVLAGQVEFAVSSSNQVWDAVNGAGIWEDDPQPALQALFTVHTESVALVVREDSDIYTLDDLRGRIVNVGFPGSPHRNSAEELLERHGIDISDDIESRNLLHNEAAAALVAGEIEAFFSTSPPPDADIVAASEGTSIRLIPLDNETVRALVAETPHYSMARVPTGHYRPFDPTDEAFWTWTVDSYGTEAIVITNALMPEEIVNDVKGFVLRHLNEFRNDHPFFYDLTYDEMRDDMVVPIHPGAVGEWVPVDPWWIW